MAIIKVKPGDKINLRNIDPGDTGKYDDKKTAQKLLADQIERMAALQNALYAEDKQSLLIVLQALDAGGKDGTIRRVLSGVNPQGVKVTSFKSPTEEELSHDFLWRVHKAVPPQGMIGVFNRSHYEDVLIVRVHEWVPKSVWQARFDHINNFEKLLTDNNVRILKFYLHISKDEQKERFQERLDIPEKRWKFNPADLEERSYWNDYWDAFEDVFEKCSPKSAPWYIVSANRKWYRNLVIAETIVEALEDMDPKYPKPAEGLDDIVID
ncbi:MAG: polyphosphate kinase 2 family protein [Chloroflexota bacterium]